MNELIVIWDLLYAVGFAISGVSEFLDNLEFGKFVSEILQKLSVSRISIRLQSIVFIVRYRRRLWIVRRIKLESPNHYLLFVYLNLNPALDKISVQISSPKLTLYSLEQRKVIFFFYYSSKLHRFREERLQILQDAISH